VVAAPTTADIGVREQRRTQYVVGCAVLGTGRHDRTQILGQATDPAAEFVSGGEGEVEALEVASSFWS
jgi:hypothetical protein